MKRVIALLFLASSVAADGPKFKHQDVLVEQEFQNVYQDVHNQTVAISSNSSVISTLQSSVSGVSLSALQSSMTAVFALYSTGRANLASNGGMEHWQRGASFSSPASGAYTADRWRCEKSGAPTFTIGRDTGIDTGNGTYCLRINTTALGTGTAAYVYQKVENHLDLRGRTVSVSARIKANVANAVEIAIEDGVGTTRSSKHSGGSSWETISLSRSLSTSATQLVIAIGSYATGSLAVSDVYIDSVMVTATEAPLGWVPLHPSEDLARVQRYYEARSEDGFMGLAGSDGSFYNIGNHPTFKVSKAVTPTMTVTLVRMQDEGASADSKASYTASSDLINTSGFRVNVFKAVAGAKPNVLRYDWVAEANP